MRTGYEGCTGRLLHESSRSSVAGKDPLNLQNAPKAYYLGISNHENWSDHPGRPPISPQVSHRSLCRATSTASTIHKTSGLRAEGHSNQLSAALPARPRLLIALLMLGKCGAWKPQTLHCIIGSAPCHNVFQLKNHHLFDGLVSSLANILAEERLQGIHAAFKGGR